MKLISTERMHPGIAPTERGKRDFELLLDVRQRGSRVKTGLAEKTNPSGNRQLVSVISLFNLR